jgi:hypothetical protein
MAVAHTTPLTSPEARPLMRASWEYSQLAAMVSRLAYKPEWRFWLYQGPTFAASTHPFQASNNVINTASTSVQVYWEDEPLFLVISLETEDSTRPGKRIIIEHTFLVPHPSYKGSWKRYLLNCILDVERHESMERFAIGDEKPFFPEHGPNARLYDIIER